MSFLDICEEKMYLYLCKNGHKGPSDALNLQKEFSINGHKLRVYFYN